jgi:hypothetical protein
MGMVMMKMSVHMSATVVAPESQKLCLGRGAHFTTNKD